MATIGEGVSRRGGGATAFLAIIALSIWQLRQTWRFIVLTGLGMIAALVLVCTGPLYSQVALNASLHDFIQSDPNHSGVTLQGKITPIALSSVTQATAQLNSSASRDTGVITAAPQFSVQSPALSLVAEPYNTPPPPTMQSTSNSQVILTGFPAQSVAAHVNLIAGQLPQSTASTGNTLDIAITPEMAKGMHLKVGDVFYTLPPAFSAPQGTFWAIHVVALFTPRAVTDPFWQGNTFQASVQPQEATSVFYASVLTSSDQLVTAFSPSYITEVPEFFWSYTIDPSRVDSAHLTSVIAGLHTFLSDASSNSLVTIDESTTPSDNLTSYNDRMALAQVSVGLLLVLVIGMVLLFISLMADLLVEQRVEAIALLRSRGASRRQVFGIFAAQCLSLGVLALVLGPLLAFPVTRYLLQHFLPLSDQHAAGVGLGSPITALGAIWTYAVIAAVVIVLAMLLALLRETGFDVLALRRESARSTRRPLWQRLYLDVLIALLAVGAYSYFLYASSAISLTNQASIQTFAPLILVSAACILLAGLLLFLRFFPVMLRWATGLASRRGSVSSMLALAQMARAPQRSLRTTLLFTLATAFAIFTLIFIATQNQRIFDVASYEAGASFSAQIADTTDSLGKQTPLYRHIPGVAASSLGFVADVSNSNAYTASLRAVDAGNFADAAIWTSQDSSQSLKSLMQQLIARRHTAKNLHIIPVIVDAATWQGLRLKKNVTFSMGLEVDNPQFNALIAQSAGNQSQQAASASINLTFLVIGEVTHIPTMVDMGQSSATDLSDAVASAGNTSMLADYKSVAAAYAAAVVPVRRSKQTSFVPPTLPLNYVWLRTQDNANLKPVRAFMQKKLAAGTSLFDQQMLIDALQHDPFYLDLLGVLALGTLTPLVLALLSSLLTSWLTAYSRLTTFALLRALGSAPRQLASVLSWEQGIVYTIMFVLGILAGAVLSGIVLPVLVITNVALIGGVGTTVSGANLADVLPPVHIVLPEILWIVMGSLLGISVVALVMMVFMVSRPSISQTLRLNAD